MEKGRKSPEKQDDLHMNGRSVCPQNELLELLKEKAPEIFVEGKIDPAKLKQTLGEDVSADKERYGLNWAGKSDCFRHIQEPTTATLKPCRDESVDFDTTENLFIEGDNLQVLKVLQKSYYGKVKMIYIDPPYNTGNDTFIYPDRFAETQDEYLQRIGDKDAEGNMTTDGFWRKNSRDAGHFHSNWLSMMYPRLFLAKNLLRPDGVIFVSIDDNEVENLKLIMNEIFGEENHLGMITVVSNLKGRSDDKFFATAHNYLLCYSKGSFESNGVPLPDEYFDDYPEVDDNGKRFRYLGLRKRGSGARREDRPNMYFPIYGDAETGKVSLTKSDSFNEKIIPKLSNGTDGRWRWGKDTVAERIDELGCKFVGTEKRLDVFQIDYAENENGVKRIKPKTIWTGSEFSNEAGTLEVKGLFKRRVFDNPKPIGLIKYCLEQAVQGDDIVLDFFAGSCTTAHSVMELNSEDGGNRKFVCVQLPELCDEKTETGRNAIDLGYKTISDLGKERIRRAAQKIKDEQEGTLDFGFKVFKLDQSNFKIWRSDVQDGKQLEKQLSLFVDNVNPGAQQENILYELILKSGLDLNVKVEAKKANKKQYFIIEGGKLLLCLEEKITEKLVEKLIAEKPEKVICLDRAFAGNDQLKTNTALQMEAKKIEFKVI